MPLRRQRYNQRTRNTHHGFYSTRDVREPPRVLRLDREDWPLRHDYLYLYINDLVDDRTLPPRPEDMTSPLRFNEQSCPEVEEGEVVEEELEEGEVRPQSERVGWWDPDELGPDGYAHYHPEAANRLSLPCRTIGDKLYDWSEDTRRIWEAHDGLNLDDDQSPPPSDPPSPEMPPIPPRNPDGTEEGQIDDDAMSIEMDDISKGHVYGFNLDVINEGLQRCRQMMDVDSNGPQGSEYETLMRLSNTAKNEFDRCMNGKKWPVADADEEIDKEVSKEETNESERQLKQAVEEDHDVAERLKRTGRHLDVHVDTSSLKWFEGTDFYNQDGGSEHELPSLVDYSPTKIRLDRNPEDETEEAALFKTYRPDGNSRNRSDFKEYLRHQRSPQMAIDDFCFGLEQQEKKREKEAVEQLAKQRDRRSRLSQMKVDPVFSNTKTASRSKLDDLYIRYHDQHERLIGGMGRPDDGQVELLLFEKYCAKKKAPVIRVKLRVHKERTKRSRDSDYTVSDLKRCGLHHKNIEMLKMSDIEIPYLPRTIVKKVDECLTSYRLILNRPETGKPLRLMRENLMAVLDVEDIIECPKVTNFISAVYMMMTSAIWDPQSKSFLSDLGETSNSNCGFDIWHSLLSPSEREAMLRQQIATQLDTRISDSEKWIEDYSEWNQMDFDVSPNPRRERDVTFQIANDVSYRLLNEDALTEVVQTHVDTLMQQDSVFDVRRLRNSPRPQKRREREASEDNEDGEVEDGREKGRKKPSR